MEPALELVRFRICDVIAPPAEDLLVELYAEHVLEGTVIASATHHECGSCALVKVTSLDQPLVVSQNRLF